MSGVRWNVVTAPISTGTALKTLVQVIAASNHRIQVEELNISFEGVSNTATPIKVEVLRQSTAGTVSSLTPVKGNDSDDETLQITAGHTATAEPTAGDILEIYYVHPQGGRDWQAPFSKPFIVKGGGRLGVRVTAAASINAVVTLKGEE